MPMGDLLEDVRAKPFPEFNCAFLIAGRAEVAAFAGKCQQIFMTAIFAFYPGETMMQVVPIEITRDNLFDIRPPEAVQP